MNTFNTHIQQTGFNVTGLLIRLLVIMTLAFSFISAAQARGSELEIALWNQGDFEIQICGQRYHADGTITIDDLQPGMERVRIVQRRQSSCGTSGNVKVLYNGYVRIPSSSKVIACVRPQRQLRIVDILKLRPQQCGTRPIQWGNGNGHNDWGYGNGQGQGHGQGGWGTTQDVDYCDCGCGCTQDACSAGVCCDNCTMHGHDDGFEGHGSGDWDDYGHDDMDDQVMPLGGGTDIGYGSPAIGSRISRGELNDLIDEMKQTSFEQARFNLAKRRLRNRSLTAYQVKHVMEQFYFEDTKLRMAKFAYSRTSDQQNFWVVNDAFDFQNSIEELEEYIQFNG